MDEKGATLLFDLMRQANAAAAADASSRAARPARYLIVLKGGLPGRMLPLEPGVHALGRSSENDLPLPDMNVSRRHARLEVPDDGPVRITDLGSTNGTYVNGERLAPNQPTEIAEGDRLGFGPSVLIKYDCPDACEENYQRELFERAVRDSLTGLYNRGYFFEQAVVLERRAAVAGLGLAVLMLDVDHFKAVNDTHGHDVGDAVLREVAQVIRQATRADDLVARFGGEEFVAAIPIGNLELGAQRAERVRHDLATRSIRIGDGPTLSVTGSIGLAYAPPDRPRRLPDLLTAADEALYGAKRSGRNRVVIHAEMTPEPTGSMTTIDFVHPFGR